MTTFKGSRYANIIMQKTMAEHVMDYRYYNIQKAMAEHVMVSTYYNVKNHKNVESFVQ
jgi:hypothetical protein